MSVKCIAIGNPLMGDDGIGSRIIEAISDKLAEQNIQVIDGETDIDYVIDQIEDDDFLYIIDATYFGLKPTSVSFLPIDKCGIQKQITMHQMNLIQYLNLFKKNIQGYLIGVEVEKIQFSTDISTCLENEFLKICESILQFILQK